MNALVLSLDDRFRELKEPSTEAKRALSILWKTQVTDGEFAGSWEWLSFGMEPWEGEGGRYFGASMAAIAVGTARENGYVMADADAREGLSSLRKYLFTNYGTQNLHNRVWMLWASAKVDGLLTPAKRKRAQSTGLCQAAAGRRVQPGLTRTVFTQRREGREQDVGRVRNGADTACAASCGRRER